MAGGLPVHLWILPAWILNQQMTEEIVDSYASPTLWSGLNRQPRIVGTKFLIGEPHSARMLADVFRHLKLNT